MKFDVLYRRKPKERYWRAVSIDSFDLRSHIIDLFERTDLKELQLRIKREQK